MDKHEKWRLFTESGRAVLNAARASLEQLSIAIQSVQEDHHSISGTIRLASAIDFATICLSAQLAKFIERHPQIEIQFTASNENQDLLGEQLDLTIRVGWLAESSHKARRIGQFKQLVVAL
jgi:DNA-binding transcriptional LysR family regulator